MRLIIKNTLKNILSNKGRSILMILMVFAASIAVMVSLDMMSSIEEMIIVLAKHESGNVDVYVDGKYDWQDVKDLPEYMIVEEQVGIDTTYYQDPRDYAYVIDRSVTIRSFSDYETACRIGMIRTPFEITGNEVVVTSAYVSDSNVKIGDEITLKDINGNPVTVVVKEIYEAHSGDYAFSTVFTSQEYISKFADRNAALCYVKVIDESKCKEFEEKLKDLFPSKTIYSMESITNEMGLDGVKKGFYLATIVALLFVAFISISTSEKIVCERMSTIGTLRSLGVSNKKTAFILILENILYALIGTSVGAFVYGSAKIPLLKALFIMTDSEGRIMDIGPFIKPVSPLSYIITFVVMFVLVCAYPAFELLKVSKTAIRDIIFNRKDTQFVYSKSRAYFGAILLLIGVITGFMNRSFWGLLISIVSIVFAGSILIPFALLGVGKALESYYGKKNKVMNKYAVKNMYNNKSVVANSVLVISSLMMALLLTNMCLSMADITASSICGSDLIIKSIFLEEKFFDFMGNIEDINKYETLISENAEASINGDKKSYYEFTVNQDYELYKPLLGVTSELDKDEIVISHLLAMKYNLKVGDTLDITFNPDYFFPITRTFTVKEIYKFGSYYDLESGPVVLNKDTYSEFFDLEVSAVMINCDDVESMRAKIQPLLPKGIVFSQEELKAQAEIDARTVRLIATLVVIGTVCLALIGIGGNQVMGFEARKREFAILYSTSMPKKKIYHLLVLENLISIVIAAIATWIGYPLLAKAFNYAYLIVTNFESREIYFSVQYSILYTGLITIAFIASAIVPINRIQKMNAAQELKYE